MEETNWDLLVSVAQHKHTNKPKRLHISQRAVSRVMPPDTQAFNPSSSPDVMIVDDPISAHPNNVATATDVVNLGNNVGHSLPRLTASNSDVEIVHPSTSSDKGSAPRMIRFNVQYCDRIIPVDVPDTGTAGKSCRSTTRDSMLFCKFCLINMPDYTTEKSLLL